MHPSLKLALIALVSLRARAIAQPPSASMTFDEAVGLSSRLPDVTAAHAAAVAERRIAIPRPWGALLVTASPQLRLAAERGAEGTLAVQQPIPLDDVAGARRRQLAAQADAQAAAAAAAQLDARLVAGAAWIEAWAARERRDAAEQDLAIARQLLAVTERGAAAGAFTGPELADARAFVIEAEVRVTDAEGEVADAAFTLGAATGDGRAIAAAGDLPSPDLPAAAAWDQLAARARQLPAVAARRLSARAARARAVEERAARGRQIIVGAELARDAPGALLVGLSIGMALPHDRGTREARLAEIEGDLADADAATLAVRAAADLARARHDLEHTGELLATLRDHLAPAVDDAAARRQRAFEVGETTIVELLGARRTALAAHARLADARAAHAWARVRAWLLLAATEVTP